MINIPNYLWDEGWMTKLHHSELILLLHLVRMAPEDGNWAFVGESQLTQETGLSRSSLKRARKALVAVGLVEMTRERELCGYRLTRWPGVR